MKEIIVTLAIIVAVALVYSVAQNLIAGTGPNCPGMDATWIGVCK